MTVSQIAERLDALEKEFRQFRAERPTNGAGKKWWRESAGRFSNDPLFDQIVELGRRYRKSKSRKGR